ncbi:DUF4905 domain-containing protein [Arcicella sp. LKC2W]|uniref:DUF4905 domain-containing protein n=1 Tax=Arcicella sp. LKC2W TaxID=2984198 RepID=UPI002B22165B|nr:DUF4905 domain-containing protein [Arcicella sp. LKC2W]MEA5459758.1 DUF4905 domain-containing protein [Arcicella sp. LKC2W]
MKQKINHTLSGKIWNTAFGGDYAALEIRDELSRQVSFSGINLLTGNVLWENNRPEKSWWLGLVGIFKEYLILHKYSSQQKPEPEGVLILNIQTGEVIQRLDNWVFFDFKDDILVVYQLENNYPIYKNIELHENRPSITQLDNHTATSSVIHYPEDSPHFPTIFKFLYRLLGIEAQKAVDYLEISNKIIISYYIYREKSFQNYLLVTNREREILLNDLIAETEGVGIDTFTVKSDTLLYVKNETQFIGYEL